MLTGGGKQTGGGEGELIAFTKMIEVVFAGIGPDVYTTVAPGTE
jgi:hypothetical protein